MKGLYDLIKNFLMALLHTQAFFRIFKQGEGFKILMFLLSLSSISSSQEQRKTNRTIANGMNMIFFLPTAT